MLSVNFVLDILICQKKKLGYSTKPDPLNESFLNIIILVILVVGIAEVCKRAGLVLRTQFFFI